METAIEANGHAAASEAYRIIVETKKKREQLFRRNSGIGVFYSYKVFLVQFKDLTGITSVPKWALLLLVCLCYV